jgi:hypothetical protein
MPIDVRVDDIATLRKPHPCGSSRWRVVRIGADIGLVCLGCGRRIMLTRRVFEKRCKRLEPADARRADALAEPRN